MIPPRSPYSLIQEDLWPDEWKILVACMLLNCTTRAAMEKVLPRLFSKYPDATAMAAADHGELAQVIARLGFGNRRAGNLIKMSQHYLGTNWKHARDLPGIGEYAAAAWEIFVRGIIPKECPKDHALTRWWEWYVLHASFSTHEKL
jgi:methyl-CpG-binding domain protein 4